MSIASDLLESIKLSESKPPHPKLKNQKHPEGEAHHHKFTPGQDVTFHYKDGFKARGKFLHNQLDRNGSHGYRIKTNDGERVVGHHEIHKLEHH